MNTKWKLLAYALAIFLAGAVTGSTIAVKYTRHSLDRPPTQTQLAQTMRSHLSSRVGLSADQLRQIDPIIDETAGQLEAIHSEMTQSIARVFANFHHEIAVPGHLTDAQKAILIQIEKEHVVSRPQASTTASTP